MVKTEFGPDAMILSSRQDRRKGLFGFSAKQFCEVTAALPKAPRGAPDPSPQRESGPTTLEAFQSSLLAPLAREVKELRARVEKLTVPGEGIAPRKREEGELAPRTLPRSEVEELKQVLLRSMGAPAKSDPAKAGPHREKAQERPREKGAPGALEALAAELRENGVGEKECRALLAPVAAAAARGEGGARLREALRESIAASVRCAPLKVNKGETKIMALVGPTGVGKTTTIAKLAALAYKRGAKVALITIDTFRVGGVNQLETYSRIMGVPLAVATTPAELATAIKAHADKHLVFIDTAGRSPRDREKLMEMKAFLAVNPAIETHLCLSATTRDRELAQAVARFGVLPVSRLLFTKLDESESFGSIVNVHLRDKFPLSYFTTGQRVPEDIETATSHRLAGLVLRETKP